jgi:hypothetical protein
MSESIRFERFPTTFLSKKHKIGIDSEPPEIVLSDECGNLLEGGGVLEMLGVEFDEVQ